MWQRKPRCTKPGRKMTGCERAKSTALDHRSVALDAHEYVHKQVLPANEVPNPASDRTILVTAPTL